jgi:uncharacterized protein
LFVTLTSRRSATRTGAAISIVALGLALGLGLGPTPAQAVRELPCATTSEMLSKGLEAYKQNRYEIAVPAFECVIRNDGGPQKFYAEFYLARIYSDETGGFVDHRTAYTLFQGLAESVDQVDADDPRRGPFVAKSVTAVAGYVRRGLPEIGLKPDLDRAVEYFRSAATFHDEPDAQFELAKLHLAGKGVPLDVRLGLHYIQKLVQDSSHAGAQAYLADLHWTGTHVRLDHVRSLALIKLAAENAQPSDKLWIEDSYQNYFCGTQAAERARAADLVVAFRRTFARGPNLDRAAPPMPAGWAVGGRREFGLSRTCANGERIDMELRSATEAPPLASSITQQVPQPTLPAGMRSPPTR